MRSKFLWFGVSALFILSCSSKPTDDNPIDEKEDPPPPIGQVFPLSKEKAERLLKRLPALEELLSDIKEFSLRDRSLPPPKTAKTLNLAFAPVDGEAPSPNAEKLTLLRHAPDGEVPIVPNLSLTFSRPMVALGEAKKLSAAEVPVKLTPQPEGDWRWLGDKTLVFEPALDRMPSATEYIAEVPAGTKSALGETIEAAQSFTFATPAPRITSSYPDVYTAVGLSPVVLMVFDQRVDAAAILKSMQVRAPAKATLHIASEKELAADAIVTSRIKGLTPKTWAAFAFDAPLPSNTSIQLTLPVGAYSAEGPRPTKTASSINFKTYGPFSVTAAGCSYPGSPTCSPQDGWYVYFTNPIDNVKLKKESLQIEPAPKSYTANAYGGNELYIYGEFSPQTTYKLTVKNDVVDSFGQTLSAVKSFTIKVGDAVPSLVGPSTPNVVLDPLGNPSFSIFSTGYKTLEVSLYKVEPTQYKQFITYTQNRYYDTKLAVPGTLISTKSLRISTPNEKTESRIDVSEALKDGLGQVAVVVKPPSTTPRPTDYYNEPEINVWAQATKIGIDAFSDNTDLVAYVSSLQDGTPLAGVEVGFTTTAIKVTSDENGMVKLAIPPTLFSGVSENQLIATKGSDVALLTESWGGSVGYYQSTPDQLVWYVFDDRHLYRPGEEVKVKGWIRRNNYGKGGDLTGIDKAVTKLSYVLNDAFGNEVAKGDAQLNGLGGFDLSMKLPDTMNLGQANLTLKSNSFMEGREAYHYFDVQEFRRPEFEVKATASEGPFFINSSATFAANAQYYTGGGLPNAPVTWEISASPSYFTPPNQSEYSFGSVSNPYFWSYRYEPPAPYVPPLTVEGFTNELGNHETKFELKPLEKAQAQSVTAQATIMDVNQQAWAASASIVVHPSSVYVGLKSDKYFVEKGQEYPLDIIVSDIEGKLTPQKKVALRFAKVTWEQEEGKSVEKEGEPEPCDITSEDKPSKCTFHPKEGGQFRVTATVTDDQGRKNESQLSVWVSGEANNSRKLEQERVMLIPDQKEYKPGDIAKVLVISPFSPAEGVFLVRRSGIVKSERFSIKDGSATLSVQIEDGHTPGVQVSVALSGQAIRAGKDGKPDESLPKRPAFGAGVLTLSVPATHRTLEVKVTPNAKEIAPGVNTAISVLVKDAAGKPVKDADVTLVVVDEAVLSLGGYTSPDPIAALYGGRYDPTREYYLRSFLQLEDPTKIPPPPPPPPPMGGAYDQPGSAINFATASVTAAPVEEISLETKADGKKSPAKPMLKMKNADKSDRQERESDSDKSGGEGQNNGSPIQLRKEFGALALFVGSATTDKKGLAKVEYKLPDNLTRYRVIAVVAAGDKNFGVGEETVTAKLPLMARASAPRFLNFGDKALIPVVLQNLTDKPMTVQVAMRATSLVSIEGDGFIATVPANDRLEVRFPVTVQKTGIVRFQVAASGTGKAKDASEFTLPIYTPATTEANALYGVVDDGVIAQPIATPKDAFPGYGGLEITTSSTALSSLTDAMVYLVSYPYECSEQISSRVMAMAALKDVLTAFNAPGLPSEAAMKTQIEADLKRLKELQHYSGGFDFWRSDRKPWPYLTVHVTHALARVKEKGFTVNPDMLRLAQNYLQSIDSYLYDERYTDEAKDVIIAYSLYVRMLLGDADTNRAKSLLSKGFDKLSIESVGWILAVLSTDKTATKEIDDIKTFLLSRVAETAGEAHFTTSYREEDSYVLLSSDRRADAVLLDALIRLNTATPNDSTKDLIVKLVAGLLNHRTAGRWGSTQENSFVLLALDNYFNTYEKATPEFVAKAWLGDGYAGAQEFKGRTTEQKSLMVPMNALLEAGEQSIFTLSKEGTGRLYYRLGLTYAPKSLVLKPADFGFTVTRTYEGVDSPDDVTKGADGTWRVKAGARVRVKLQMVAPTRRYHVALVDPLPAGFEALNPELKGTGALPPEQPVSEESENTGPWGRYYWWWGPWYQHENLRDERVEAFTTLLWEGVHKYSYIARATTPGTFIVPPTKAEEMYSPEIFGRAATEKVIVEAPANGM
jgi:alpha-2-macroglobulin